MIEVRNLTKYYGLNRAVSDLTFEVERGEVLGFLGPNGAGKTTTMKMLTCYLPPSSGSARIFGFDILSDSMEVRRRIGYLPEKTPLYQDMPVDDYLRFVARLKGIGPAGIQGALDRALSLCGLEDVSKKTIGKLSKGYQQRTGIAQAIIHDPELLILDEPTLGLDPRQIIDIRKLIRDLGKDRTVILSSHILPEVSQVCNRVIVINKGELVAVDSPENLRGRLKKSSVTRVTVGSPPDPSSASGIISSVEGVLMVKRTGEGEGKASFTVESSVDADVREEISRRLVEGGVPLLEIYNEELTLEDIFIKLVTEESRQ